MNTMNMNEQQNSTEQFSPQTGTKTSSKKRYLILLLIIALIICAGAGIAFASFFFSPKAVLARAAKNTFSENNFPGFRSAMTAVQSGKYETAYSMTLNKLQIDTDMANSKLFADTEYALLSISLLLIRKASVSKELPAWMCRQNNFPPI